MRFSLIVSPFLISAVAFAATPAFAQTPINAPGAMQPSTGTGVFHEMLLYRNRGADPTLGELGADEYIALSQIAYGLTRNISVQLDIPIVYTDRELTLGDDGDLTIADMTLLVKWRLFQDDPAPTETTRFSVVGGLQIPGDSTYRMDASHDAWDPIIGGVFSTVRGRHGVNASVLYEFYTGGDQGMGDAFSDSVRYDASYLFRIDPVEYTAESTGALYAVAELNGFYDTNGDNELFLSPGIMYESRTYTLDASVMIPVHQDLDYWAET
jgi:hypothetical protein